MRSEEYRRVSVNVEFTSKKQSIAENSVQYLMQIDNPKVLRRLNSSKWQATLDFERFVREKSVACVIFFLFNMLCGDFLCASSLFRVNHVLNLKEIVWELMLFSCRFPTYVELAPRIQNIHCESEYVICIRQNHNAALIKKLESRVGKTRNSKIFN